MSNKIPNHPMQDGVYKKGDVLGMYSGLQNMEFKEDRNNAAPTTPFFAPKEGDAWGEENLAIFLDYNYYMDNPRREKAHHLFWLAENTTSGHIVELGAGAGLGTLCLAYGSLHAGHNLPITAIDSYELMEFGHEFYSVQNSPILKSAIFRTGLKPTPCKPTLIVQDFALALQDWVGEIGLLVWDGDPSKPYNSLLGWAQHVKKGGFVAMLSRQRENVVDVAASMLETEGFSPPVKLMDQPYTKFYYQENLSHEYVAPPEKKKGKKRYERK